MTAALAAAARPAAAPHDNLAVLVLVLILAAWLGIRYLRRAAASHKEARSFQNLFGIGSARPRGKRDR